MRVDAEELDHERIQSEIVVVGAGPGGISTALEFARQGHDVVLIESGGMGVSETIQQLGNASHFDEARHAPMQDCTRRQMGGASVIWGGRCLPYDPIDFEQRPYIPFSDWPVAFDEVTPYFERTCDYFRCGRAVFNLHGFDDILQDSIVPGLPDGDVLSSDLERWSLPTNFGREYRVELDNHPRIRVLTSLTCTAIELDGSGTRVRGLTCRTSNAGREIEVVGRVYVVACGGVDTTRLLLASNRVEANGIGNHSDQLGRYYMGHISGRIARVRFSTDPRKTVYGFDRDRDTTYVRRRLTFSAEFQRQEQLSNIAGLLVNPEIANPDHGNGVLSFAYLALASPAGRFFIADAIRQEAIKSSKASSSIPHFRNMLFDLPRTLHFIPTFGYKRFIARRKVPAFFQYTPSNIYLLHYHGEQIPDPASRIRLGQERDALGMRRVDIDFRYSQQDVDSVIRAHRHWNDYLEDHGVGQLEYLTENLEESVWNQAKDGFHQVGTTRMSEDPAHGVVDRNCKVHGIDDLFIASSSNFVTSGQANSTFMIVAFALKMVEHIRTQVLKG
ncbi:GMC family oxidoreductase [Myxococcota bacterium]|nr:GMC family oxidoreductase [Myxococcota bacterium]